MPLTNLFSHHRSAADLWHVVDLLSDRHKISDTVPWQFMATAVQMVCVIAHTDEIFLIA